MVKSAFLRELRNLFFFAVVASSRSSIRFASATFTTWYVEVSGNATTNCSQANRPCGSIQTAINLASENDTILLGPGTFIEYVCVNKTNITLAGAVTSPPTTIIQSAVLQNHKAAGNDIILDIFGWNVTIQDIAILHPNGTALQRDIGIIVRKTAHNTTLQRVRVERQRTGTVLEPTNPGSRGLLVYSATGTVCVDSTFTGNYQDHVYIPASHSNITRNTIQGATRLGISLPNNTNMIALNNTIVGNIITDSGIDGIQVEGDFNSIISNQISSSGAYGIHICGNSFVPGNVQCEPPGLNATAEGNLVEQNLVNDNSLGGILDQGENNTLLQNYVNQYTSTSQAGSLTGMLAHALITGGYFAWNLLN